MPSASTACMSDCLVMTTSCPIAVTGIVPVCLRVILKSVQDDGTTIDDTLYCIASLPSISVAQSVTTAVPLPLSIAGAAAVVAAGAGAIVTGASAAAVEAVVAGVAMPDDVGEDELSLQAAKASAQAAASRLSFTFIDSSPRLQNRIIDQRCSVSREGRRQTSRHPAGSHR